MLLYPLSISAFGGYDGRGRRPFRPILISTTVSVGGITAGVVVGLAVVVGIAVAILVYLVKKERQNNSTETGEEVKLQTGYELSKHF